MARRTSPDIGGAGAAGSPLHPATQMRLVRDAFDAWSNGSGSIYELMDDDAAIVVAGTSPHSGTFGKQVFLRDVAAPFMARFAVPPAPRLRDLWSNKRGVVAAADATGTRRDGQPYANAYVFIFDFRDARVVQVTEFLDLAAFERVWDGVVPEGGA